MSQPFRCKPYLEVSNTVMFFLLVTILVSTYRQSSMFVRCSRVSESHGAYNYHRTLNYDVTLTLLQENSECVQLYSTSTGHRNLGSCFRTFHIKLGARDIVCSGNVHYETAY
jgi:hypothetical protein